MLSFMNPQSAAPWKWLSTLSTNKTLSHV